MKVGWSSSQSHITDYFDTELIYDIIETNSVIKNTINRICGKPVSSSVTPLLQRIYDNARNNTKLSKNGNRHDELVKKFSLSLMILTGKSGYDLLQKNALPSYSTMQRMISTKERMVEGKFYFQ